MSIILQVKKEKKNSSQLIFPTNMKLREEGFMVSPKANIKWTKCMKQ